MLSTIQQKRWTNFLVFSVFILVLILFAGHHAMTGLEKGGASHQSDAYSCLFAFCVAVISASMLMVPIHLILLKLEQIPSTGTHLLFLPEKPPRKRHS